MNIVCDENENTSSLWDKINNLITAEQKTLPITELKQTLKEVNKHQRELELQNKQLLSTINNLNANMQAVFQTELDGILLADEFGTILNTNKSIEKIFKYNNKELIGTNVKRLISEHECLKFENYLAAYHANKEEKNSGEVREFAGQKKDGQIIPLELSVGEAKGINGKSYIIILRDISEITIVRSHREQLSRELNLISETRGIGVWTWDLLTNELNWDEHMYEIYGISKNTFNINYQIWRNAVHPDDIDTSEKKVQFALNNSLKYSNTFRIYRPNGELRWINAAADILRKSDGTAYKMFGFNIDITNEYHTKEVLKQESHMARAANEAKSRFLANMSHEIRTPMNGIIGMLELLRDTTLNNDQKRMIQSIRYSSYSLLNIINDILDFSKIEAGQMDIEQIPISIPKTIEDGIHSMWLEANRSGVDIFLDLDPSIPNMVYGDSLRLRQIVTNLVNNATKFSKDLKERGKIWVSSQHIADSSNGERIEISVEDNGIGMTQEQVSKLYLPFIQADISTTRKYGGTGLGLCITRSLIEMMGGKIKVFSNPGEGSKFTIDLPCKSALPGKTPTLTNQVNISGLNILVLIKNNRMGNVICSLISYWQSKAQLSSSFNQSIKLLEQAQNNKQMFDIIILGPEFSYDETTKHLDLNNLNLTKTNQPRYLLLTNNPSEKTGMRLPSCIVVGAYPMKQTDLKNAIAILVGRESPFIRDKSTLLENEIDSLPPPTHKEAQQQGRLILVAEDQLTNQEVIRRQLHKLGLACTIVNNGQEALIKWKKGRYGLVLTDCHMPKMDGFELTSKIRKIENKNTQVQKIPIIAITANALVGEADNCLAAGMDDYLSKPVQIKDLKLTLERWLPQRPKTNTSAKLLKVDKSSTDFDYHPINLHYLSQILGTEDNEVLQSILSIYWSTAQQDWNQLEQAFEKKDFAKLREIVHAAKGAAHSSGAESFGDILQTLQNNIDAKDTQKISETYKISKEEFLKLEAFFKNREQKELV